VELGLSSSPLTGQRSSRLLRHDSFSNDTLIFATGIYVVSEVKEVEEVQEGGIPDSKLPN
jgi:hypothetical protein